MARYRRDKLKGCGKILYHIEESNYPQDCDGFALCNGSYRLCDNCMKKPIKELLEEY